MAKRTSEFTRRKFLYAAPVTLALLTSRRAVAQSEPATALNICITNNHEINDPGLGKSRIKVTDTFSVNENQTKCDMFEIGKPLELEAITQKGEGFVTEWLVNGMPVAESRYLGMIVFPTLKTITARNP